jgi:hypothetical protein
MMETIRAIMEELIMSGDTDINGIITIVENRTNTKLHDKQKEALSKIIEKRIKQVQKEKGKEKGVVNRNKKRFFTHGVNVIIKEGSQKGKFGVQREYHTAKYELTRKALTKVIATSNYVVGDKLIGQFGQGVIVGEENEYYKIDDISVPVEDVIEIVSFVVNGIIKLGIIQSNVEVKEEPLESMEEDNKMLGMNKQEIEKYIEDLKESKRKLEEEREELYNKLVGEGMTVEEAKMDIQQHNKNISKIKDQIHALRAQLKELNQKEDTNMKKYDKSLKEEMEERRYKKLMENLGVSKDTKETRQMSTMERLKKGLETKRSDVQRYHMDSFVSTPVSTVRHGSMMDLRESKIKESPMDMMERLRSKMTVLYNIQEVDLSQNMNVSLSEDEKIRAFARGIAMGMDVVYKDIYKAEVKNKYIIDKKRGLYTTEINFVPKMFVVEYNKTGMFEKKYLGMKHKGVYEVLKGPQKGTEWTLVKKHPTRIVVDTDIGIITNVTVRRGNEYYVEKLQPKHVFYMDIELKNGNMAQVDNVYNVSENEYVYEITEKVANNEIKREVTGEEIRELQSGFRMEATEGEEGDEYPEYVGELDEDEFEGLENVEDELKAGFKDTERTAGEYVQLTSDQKQIKLIIDNILKAVSLNVETSEMMKMINECESRKLKNETPFQIRARILCIVYYEFLKTRLSESQIMPTDMMQLSSKKMSEIYAENKGISIDEEGPSQKSKYITKYYSRVNDPLDFLSDSDSELLKESVPMSDEDILSNKLGEVDMNKEKKFRFITTMNKNVIKTFEEFIAFLLEKGFFSKKEMDLLRKKGKYGKNVKDLDIILPLINDICNKMSSE